MSVCLLPAGLLFAMGSASRPEPGQHCPCLGDDGLDHLAGRPDVAYETRALAARGAAVLDVALLAGADCGGLAHALELDGKQLDLRLAILPRAREVVADEPAGLARRGARHHGAFLIDGDDLALVVVVTVRLASRDEPRAHPDPGRAECQGGDEAAAVRDAARREHEARRD